MRYLMAGVLAGSLWVVASCDAPSPHAAKPSEPAASRPVPAGVAPAVAVETPPPAPATPPAVQPRANIPWDTFPDTWVATDALGRKLPTLEDGNAPAARPHHVVGMFCFLSNDNPKYPVFDNTKILAADANNPKYGGIHINHWWGEPWFGYYLSNDKAVIRKHVQMLHDAGVDVLIFDNTNGLTYPKDRLAVCEVMEQMRGEGLAVPQICFITGHGAAKELHRDFYSKNLYPDLWFRWLGKPLMLVHEDSPGVEDFFTLRTSWAWTAGAWFKDGRDAWPWLDHTTNRFGWHDDPKVPEAMSVATAQHATTSIGRSYHAGQEPPENQRAPEKGIYFQEQWDRVFPIDPKFVFITGWDEWTAMRFPADKPGPGHFAGRDWPAGYSTFVDEYDSEFSRDIEPVKGDLGDDYYCQLVSNVRKYKGVRALPAVSRKTIDLSAGFGQWSAVGPEFRDDIGDPVHRDFAGWGDNHYVNRTGRNDVVASKMCYDDQNLYFYVRTRDPLTPHTDPNWMMLMIDADQNAQTGWLGYDFMINRVNVGEGDTAIEKPVMNGSYEWQEIGRVKYTAAGNELMVAVPRQLLGANSATTGVDFKWADNIQGTGEPSDFTLNGDAAPNDRYNYRARMR